MRTWAFWRAQGTTHPEFDSGTTPKDRSWEDYMPYNNVIWLWYLLDYTIKHYKGSQRSLNKFSTETAKLRHRLHPDTKALDGGFTSAWEVLKFSVESGWITSEEVGELDLWIPGEEAPR
jgi:serine/threonine-protein kinase haspin